jgi:hypothetical protein
MIYIELGVHTKPLAQLKDEDNIIFPTVINSFLSSLFYDLV